MSIDRVVLAFAGIVILATVAYVLFLGGSTNWLYLTGFVGLNLLQSSFTGFCPLAMILKKMGLKPGEAFS
ncbi:MAG: YgaP family membrane protein [bacterium]